MGFPPWPPAGASLGQDQAPRVSLEQQEVEGAGGEGVWEAAVGRWGFLKGSSGGHQKLQ